MNALPRVGAGLLSRNCVFIAFSFAIGICVASRTFAYNESAIFDPSNYYPTSDELTKFAPKHKPNEVVLQIRNLTTSVVEVELHPIPDKTRRALSSLLAIFDLDRATFTVTLRCVLSLLFLAVLCLTCVYFMCWVLVAMDAAWFPLYPVHSSWRKTMRTLAVCVFAVALTVTFLRASMWFVRLSLPNYTFELCGCIDDDVLLPARQTCVTLLPESQCKFKWFANSRGWFVVIVRDITEGRHKGEQIPYKVLFAKNLFQSRRPRLDISASSDQTEFFGNVLERETEDKGDE